MRTTRHFLIACLLLLGAGCGHAPSVSRRYGSPSARFCSALSSDYDHRYDTAWKPAMQSLRKWLGLTLHAELLDRAQAERLAGASLRPEAGYGEKSQILAVQAFTARDDVRLGVQYVRLSATEPDHDYKRAERFFEVPGAWQRTPGGRPMVYFPWPPEVVRACEIHSRSAWETFSDLMTGLGHIVTLGVFLWAPRLAGYPSGSSPEVRIKRPDIAAYMGPIDAWESRVELRGKKRFEGALYGHRLTATAATTHYEVVTLRNPEAPHSEYDRPNRLSMSLVYRFASGCTLEENIAIPLPPEKRGAEQLAALWAGGPRRIEELLPRAAAPLPKGVALPALPPDGARSAPQPLAVDGLALRVFDRDAAQKLLRMPLRPRPEALLYACRIAARPCQLRVETADETWETVAPDEELSRALTYDDLYFASLLGGDLTRVLFVRLQEIAGGENAPLTLLARITDHRRPLEDRLFIEVADGPNRRQAVFPLPPGAELPARIEKALAALPARAGETSAAQACELGSGDACLTLTQSGGAAMLRRACTLGQGAACRQLAAQLPAEQPRDWGSDAPQRTVPWRFTSPTLALLRTGCLSQDAESCGELAHVLPETPLTIAEQRERAAAYQLACGGGLLWACNDLAVLLARIAKADPKSGSDRCNLSVLNPLLTEACQQGDGRACENRDRLSAAKGVVVPLQPEATLESAPR